LGFSFKKEPKLRYLSGLKAEWRLKEEKPLHFFEKRAEVKND